MTPIEIFWGLAINWASSAAETQFKNALPQSDYLTQVANIYHQTVKSYEKKYPSPKKQDKKYPFYDSQTFYQACLKYRFYESLNPIEIYKEIKKDTRIIEINEEKVAYFLQLLTQNIFQNSATKSAFLAENYQQEIFNISIEVQKLGIAIQEKANTITINGNHNIVLQDINHIQELILTLHNTAIQQALDEKEKLKAYQARLAQEYEEPIWGEEKMSLKDTYIEQKYGIYRECSYFSRESSNVFIPTNEHLHLFINYWIQTKTFLNNERLSVINNRLILLLGQPGQGKSSFCKRLIYDIFHTPELQQQPCFRINFRDITNTADLINRPFQSLLDFINKEKNIQLTEDYFRNCLFILDGLDELRIKENMNLQIENELLSNLSTNLKHNYPNIRVIITSRHQVHIERFKNEFLILNLSLLQLEEEITWLQKYHLSHPETFLDINTLTTFQKFPHLKELCEQPILLYMLAQVHTQQSPIDTKANRSIIYNHLFDQVINRKWAEEGQIEALKGIDKKTIRILLQEIGFAIFQSDNEYLHKSQIQTIIDNHPKLQDTNTLLSKDALKGLMMAFYIQETLKSKQDNNKEEDKSNYGIEFMHKSLQEYLAAEKIWTEIKRIIIQDTEGDYLIHKGKQCLEIFYKCFHQQFLSQNIVGLLIEIIAADTQETKTVLADRIERFLSFYIEHDFLYTYQIEKDKNPIYHSLNTFYGTWTVLSHLQTGRNYITDKIKDKFCNLLIYLRRYKENCSLNLSYINLSDTNLCNTNLSNVDLSNANLKGTDLRRTDLSEANLSKINLSEANLNEANLSKTNLSEALFLNAYLLRTNLTGANLSIANLSKSDLYRANLSESDLYQANLSEVNLTQTNLSQADLSKTDLSRANLSEANLKEVNLSESDLRGTNLTEANLSNTNLSNITNITISQLSHSKTLINCEGLPIRIEKELREKHPHLFE